MSAARSTAAALLAAPVLACSGPFLVFPGGALSGTLVAEPVEDWSFLTAPFVDLETRPGDPYSVRIGYAVRGGRLYVDPAEGRTWRAHIVGDPRVRARFDGRIYPLTAVRVTDTAELAGFDPERAVYRLESRAP